MEEYESGRLNALMRAVDLPVGDLDVASILESGRCGERRHHVAMAGLTAGVAVVVLAGAVGAVPFVRGDEPATGATAAATLPNPPQSSTPTVPSDTAACTIQTLRAPAGVDSALAAAADPTGRLVVGNGVVGDNQGPTVLWTNGVPSVLDEPKTLLDEGVVVKGIDSHGDIAFTVGTSHIDSWLYHDGTYTKLPEVPGYPDALATAIGANGDVVGWTDNTANTGGPAVLWPLAHPGTVRELPTPHGQAAMAMTIDAAGTAGGSLGDGDKPFVWNPSGQGRALKVPSGYHKGRVFGVNGDWAVGWVGVGTKGQVVAARWNLRTGKVNVFPDNDESMSIAANGDFVGGDGSFSDSYLYHDGAFKLLPVPEVTARAAAQFITPDGRTIVGSVTQGQNMIPALWHC